MDRRDAGSAVTVTPIPPGTTPSPSFGQTPAGTTPQPPTGPGDEPSTPILVHLRVDRPPKLHEEAEFELTVRALRDAARVRARFELPVEARVVRGRRRWVGDLKAGKSVRLTLRIAFTKVGRYNVGGVALSRVSEGMTWGDDDHVYLTVEHDAGSFGWGPDGDSTTTTGPIP